MTSSAEDTQPSTPQDKYKSRKVFCQITRVMYWAFNKFPHFSRKLESLSYDFGVPVEVKEDGNKYIGLTYKIVFPSFKYVESLQKEMDVFLDSSKERTIRAGVHSYINFKEMIAAIYSFVDGNHEFKDVAVDQVRIERREIKM